MSVFIKIVDKLDYNPYSRRPRAVWNNFYSGHERLSNDIFTSVDIYLRRYYDAKIVMDGHWYDSIKFPDDAAAIRFMLEWL